MGRTIGIDLGITNAVMALTELSTPKILDNREVQTLTPSIVSLKKRKEKEEILVGMLAYDYWEYDPKNTINSIKRLIGRSYNDPQVQKAKQAVLYEIVEPSDGTKDSLRVVLGGKEYSPVDISAMILRHLKDAAEYRLGEEVTHAVVTVPAYFSQIQRASTREAVLKAGMTAFKIIDEPIAAAIACGFSSINNEKVKTFLICNISNETLDITVMNVFHDIYTSSYFTEFDLWFGGDSFKQVLVNYLVDYIKCEYRVDITKDYKAMVRIKKVASKAKETLSSSKTADMICSALMQDNSGNFIDLDLTVTQAQFVKMTTPLVNKTVAMVEKAIENAKLVDKNTGKPDMSKIDHVLMIGDMSTISIIRPTLEAVFCEGKILRKYNTEYLVALGAATIASYNEIFCPNPDPKDPTKTCDHANPIDATECERCHGPLHVIKKQLPTIGVGSLQPIDVEEILDPQENITRTPFSYGTQSAGDKYNVFVKKGDVFPTKNPQQQNFYTQTDNQPIISINVYGGENMEKASANEKYGEAFAVLPRGLPRDTLIQITIWLDVDGVFEISAQLGDGTELRPWIMGGGLDAKVVDIMHEGLKIISEKANAISRETKNLLENQERAIWDKMNRREFKEAMDEALSFRERAKRYCV